MALVEYVVFHPWKTVTVLLVGILVGLGAFYGYTVQTALGVVAVEEFDPEEARTVIEKEPEPVVSAVASDVLWPVLTVPDYLDEYGYDVQAELERIARLMAAAQKGGDFNLAAFGDPIPDEVFDSYLLVGADASGYLADTMILALQPDDDSNPIMVSLPRDLYVWNLCKETFTRLNTGLGGCGETATGSELLAIMVEDYTGIPVDHIARVNFDGFSRVIEVMGGIRVCNDHPMRDLKSHLDLPKTGCRVVDGETALAWVRSRHSEELVGGKWRAMGGADFGRQERQQDVLFQLAAKAARFSSPGSLSNKLQAVTSSVRLDSSWNLVSAVGAAWRYRGISKEDVERFTIDTSNYRTSYGQAVLLPNLPFKDQLNDVYELD